MSANISTGTRSILYFNDFKEGAFASNESVFGGWSNIYYGVLLVGLGLTGGLGYQVNQYLKDKKYEGANGIIWYLVINIIFAFLFYGFTRRSIDRTITPFFSGSDASANWRLNTRSKYLWVFLVLFPLAPAFVFIEAWDKIYLIFRKLFKGDQNEFDQQNLDDINSALSSKLAFLKTIDLDRSDRFTYLFGNLSYDKGDAASIFKDGTDVVRTPVLICSFFVALCLLIPVAITGANGESLDKEWTNNIAPVSAALSCIALIFILGTLQGYGDRVTVNREKKYNVPMSKR